MNALSFDEVFPSSGIFGLEIAPEVAARAGEPLALRGFLYGPLAANDRTYALGRAVWRHCVCCAGEPAWPDDVVVVELREPIDDARLARHGDDESEVAVAGTLVLEERRDAHPGLAAAVVLRDAVVNMPERPIPTRGSG